MMAAKKPLNTILNIITKKRFIGLFVVYFGPLIIGGPDGADELMVIFLFGYFFMLSFDIKKKRLKNFLIIFLGILLLFSIINLSKYGYS